MIEKQVNIPTKDGSMDTFLCHPERGQPWPVVILYMDAPGIREELRDMVRRIGTLGYAVFLPNLYYRTREAISIEPTKLHESGQDRDRMMAMIDTISTDLVMEDTDGLLAFIEQQPDLMPEKIGGLGYCMSGPYVYAAAARHPDSFKAIAALFGTFMVTDQPDSPHLLTSKIKGEVYLGFAEKDRFSPPDLIDTIRQELEAAAVTHEVEVYPGADHAFAFPLRAAYDRASDERHWERVIALFRRQLDS